MIKNNKGFSLVIAMGIVLITGLLAYTILEYVIPFSRSTKGIENAMGAYYQANSGIEEGLFEVYKRNNDSSESNVEEYGLALSTSKTAYSYQTSSSGKLIPLPGEGNSEYHSDYNRISQGEPIQLEAGERRVDMNDFKIYIRVPDLNGNGLTGSSQDSEETLSGSITLPYLPIVNWQLSAETDVLNATGSLINAKTIDDRQGTLFKGLLGVTLDGTEMTFEDFYGTNSLNGNCRSVGSGCTLKLSIVNPIKIAGGHGGAVIPYLEWKILNDAKFLPLRYTKIEASGKSIGYKKDLEVKVPSQTVTEAFDFTVFQ